MFLKIFYPTQAAAASLLSRPRDHADVDVDVEAELLQGLPSIVCLSVLAQSLNYILIINLNETSKWLNDPF